MKRKILLWLSNAAFLLNSACGQHVSFEEMLGKMYQNTVPLIYPDSLRQKLNDKENIVILDAREKEEFAVSHIDGALNVGYNTFKISSLKEIPKDSKIVVYCSVGYRSERIGEKLKDAGFNQVYNLYGGIFEWKNLGYDVYHNNLPTDSVHAYSQKWGVWLQKGVKVYE